MGAICTATGSPLSRKTRNQINMIMQGMFNERPYIPSPKLNYTWDIDILLDYIASCPANKNLSLIELSGKLASLIQMATMRRRIDLTGLNINALVWSDNRQEVTFSIQRVNKVVNVLTSSAKSRRLQSLTLRQLEVDPENVKDKKVCPVRCLKMYLHRTKTIRDTSSLFMITMDPFSAATCQTIENWIRKLMENAGIDTQSSLQVHCVRPPVQRPLNKNYL